MLWECSNRYTSVRLFFAQLRHDGYGCGATLCATESEGESKGESEDEDESKGESEDESESTTHGEGNCHDEGGRLSPDILCG